MKNFSYLVFVAIIFGIALKSCNKDNVTFFTVSFISNKGSTVLAQTVKEGEKATKPEDPLRSGFVFVAWYKDAELSNEWDFNTDVVTADVTLFAKIGTYPPKNREKNRLILVSKSVKISAISAAIPPKRGKNGIILGKNRFGFTGFRSISPQRRFGGKKTTKNDPYSEHIPPIFHL